MRLDSSSWTWRTIDALPIVVLLAMSACSARPAPASPRPGAEALLRSSDSAALQEPSPQAAGAIRALVDGPDPSRIVLPPAALAELQKLYRDAGYSPLWIEPDGRPSRDAHDALALLAGAADDGLDPADYDHAELARLTAALTTEPKVSWSDRARFDVVLSSGLLRYLRHLHTGRVDPRSLGLRLTPTAGAPDFAALVRSAIAGHEIAKTAADLGPPLAQYRALRATLARYRALAADTTIGVPPSSATVRRGDVYEGVDCLYRQLVALGDLPSETPAPADTARYDGVVVEGVKRFQARHGLTPDGVLGKSTLAALQVPIAWRVRQIELALERLRWLPHLGDERLIAINIPMFRLWAWDPRAPAGGPSLGMAVIAGRVRAPTPVFVEEMREVVFRPYWNVPPSILRHEILPILKRDPDYLQRQDMEIVDGPGDDARAVEATAENVARLGRGSLRLRQRQGPKNSLGLIKFVFPNEEGVYMHGTPAQALFAPSRRDFSHGCVRVEDPVSLATWALEGLPEWSRDRILAATAGPQSIHVRLARPIQVVLFYTTAAIVPEDGTIRFAEDIYGHDARLDRALATRRAVE